MASARRSHVLPPRDVDVGLARERELQLLTRICSPGVDLPPRPLQAARLLEEPVRVGRKAQARIDADPYVPAGVVWIGQHNVFRSRGMNPQSLIERGGR